MQPEYSRKLFGNSLTNPDKDFQPCLFEPISMIACQNIWTPRYASPLLSIQPRPSLPLVPHDFLRDLRSSLELGSLLHTGHPTRSGRGRHSALLGARGSVRRAQRTAFPSPLMNEGSAAFSGIFGDLDGDEGYDGL